jgi:hypothetical protein
MYIFIILIDPDDSLPGTPKYLRNDLSISCSSSRYNLGFAWAVVMIFIYPVGITVLYAYVLWVNREAIEGNESIEIEDSLVIEERLVIEDSLVIQESMVIEESMVVEKRLVIEDSLVIQESIEIQESMVIDIIPASTHSELEQKNDPKNSLMSVSEKIHKHVSEHVTHNEIAFLHRAYKGRCWYWEVGEIVHVMTVVYDVLEMVNEYYDIYHIYTYISSSSSVCVYV